MDVREEGPGERERENEGGRIREVGRNRRGLGWSGCEGNKTSETKRVARVCESYSRSRGLAFVLARVPLVCMGVYVHVRARMYICMYLTQSHIYS